MRIAGYLFLLLTCSGLLLGFGVHGAWRQQQMLRAYQPVPAVVQRNEVTSGRFGGYEPDVRFAYSVKGKSYEGTRAGPLYIGGSRDWIDAVSGRISSEGSTAYYNPSAPGDAYLLPIGRFRPYGLALAGMALFGLGLLPLLGGGVFTPEPVSLTGGPYDWYTLRAGGSHADRAFGWAGVTLAWYLLGGLLVGHYFLVIPPAYELKSGIIAALYAVAGVWPAYRACTLLGVASSLGAPKVHVTRKTAHLGEPIIVRIEQPFLRDTVVRELRVKLTCTRRDGLTSVRYFSASQMAAEDRAVRAGEVIHGEFTFEVPEKKRHPSTPFSRWEYPRTDWQIEVTARTRKCQATVPFPILAEDSHSAAKAA